MHYNPIEDIFQTSDPKLGEAIGDISVLKTIQLKVAYYVEITALSGTITIPQETSIRLNEFQEGESAEVTSITNGVPDFTDVGLDANIDINGNYTISGGSLPTSPSALIIYLTVSLYYKNNLDLGHIVEDSVLIPDSITNPVSRLEYNTDYIITGSEPIGSTFWSDNTLSVKLSNNVTGQVFKEQFLDAVNNTGSVLQNGYVARFTGTLGSSGKITAGYGIADGSIPAIYNVGIFTEDLLTTGDKSGKITVFGNINDFNTTGSVFGETWEEGDILYVSPTTSGYLTNIKPNSPNQIITIAVVIYSHVNQGILLVRPTYNSSMKDLDDVNGTPLDTTGQFPIWNNTAKYFDFTGNINDYTIAPINTVITVDTLLTNVNTTVICVEKNIIVTFTSSTVDGRTYSIVNDSNGSILLDGNGNLIVDSSTFILYSGESLHLVFVNNKWNIV